MGFTCKLAAVLLLVSVLGLSLTEAQRGRGRGRGRGQQGPPENRGQEQGQGQRGPGGRGPPGQGQRGPGGRGPGGRARPEGEGPLGEVFSWNQTLSSGAVVVQRVFVPENKSIVIYGSRGDRESEVMPSRTLYDFSGASGVVAFRPRGGFFPCFITDTTLTFSTVSGNAASFSQDGDNTVAYAQQYLDGTSEKLPEEATTALYEAQPELKRFCGWAGVVAAAEPGDLPAFDGPTRNVTILAYNSEVTLNVPSSIGGRERGRGRGRG